MSPSMSPNDTTSSSYIQSGFSKTMGWGSRPALLLIDVCKAYWTSGSPLDTSANPESAAAPESMKKLLYAAREGNVPILWTRVEYTQPDMGDAGLMFLKQSLLTVWQNGDTRGLDRWVDGLEPAEGEVIVTKKMPSAFFATSLAADLQRLNVDTVVICGVSTSGCVRATTLDAMQYGFRPMVVGSACGDRTPAIQRANLFDLNAKYADVVSEEEAIEQLKTGASKSGTI